jgi:hypothetical protein
MAKKKITTIPDPVEACQAFASLDEARPNLWHVIIGPQTWATDGHTLLVCETPNTAPSSMKRLGKRGWTSGDPNVKMPDIDQVIPTSVGAKIVIDRDYLDAILKTEPAMLQIHGLKARAPRLVAVYQLDTGKLKGTFERPDDKAAYPLQLSGPDVAYDAIGMDPRYVARAVWACYAPGERVELEVQVGEHDNLSPIRIRHYGRTALVMPMRIEPGR